MSEKNWEHWLSVNCDWLAARGLTKPGWMSVYYTLDDDCMCLAVWAESAEPKFLGGTPLYGIEKPSYPPLQILCLEGGPIVEDWLSELGMKKTDADHPRVYDTPEGSAYELFFQSHDPVILNNCFACLGGYHMTWPESETIYDHGKQFVLITIKDSEPWIEVWPCETGYKAVWRVT
jgi:hypothetical protein